MWFNQAPSLLRWQVCEPPGCRAVTPSGSELQAASPATLLKVHYCSSKSTSPMILQQLEIGVPKALGIYLEHGLYPGPQLQSKACFHDVPLNNLMPASCWFCVLCSARCPKGLVGFQKPHVRHTGSFFFFFFSGLEIYASRSSSDKSQGKTLLQNRKFPPGSPQPMISHLLQAPSGGGGVGTGLSGRLSCQSHSK